MHTKVDVYSTYKMCVILPHLPNDFKCLNEVQHIVQMYFFCYLILRKLVFQMSIIYDNFIFTRIIIVQERSQEQHCVKELSALMEMHLCSPMWSHM